MTPVKGNEECKYFVPKKVQKIYKSLITQTLSVR
jgi:hypothetical protein